MLSVTKIVEFEAAHFIPNHKGKCKNVHGHSYKLEIEVGNPNDRTNDQGMIMDFGDLKEIINTMVDSYFDHYILNDSFNNPSAELLVLWIANHLKMKFVNDINQLLKIRLWETSSSYCEWRK